MQKAKRLIGLGLSICMAITMVAGCGDKKEPVDTSTPVSSTADSSTADSSTAIDTSKAVELQWYTVGGGQPKDMDAVLEKVNEYIKPKINATLKIDVFSWGNDVEDKMAAKIAAGAKFDIVSTANWLVKYVENSSKGAYVDLTPLLDDYAPKTKANLGETLIKGASVDGKLFAIPTLKEVAHNWGFLINKKMADKNGIDISTIKTFEDIEPALQIIKEKESGVEAFQTLVGESPYRVLDFEKLVGDDVPGAVYGDGRDTTVINDFDTPEAKALFTTLNKWYKAGYIRKDADTITDMSANRKAGKVFSAIAQLKPGKDAEQSLSDNTEWKQVDLTPVRSTTRDMNGAMNAISTTSENPERALMFLELMNNDVELVNLIDFGIAGTHYTKINDTTIEQTQAGKDNYNMGTSWLMGNQFNTYLFASEDPKKWDNFRAYNDSAVASKLAGFSVNAEKIKTEVAALTAIKKQYMPGLETGKSDPATALPKFTEKLKGAGLDAALKEMQSQVDAFLAANK